MKKDWMIIESELDDDQIKVLNATNDKSCIVVGCAGSGKSVLALIKAQRIQKVKGDNYQIIVFTKALCNYMNAGRKELGLKRQFSYHEEWKWKKTLKHYANGKSFMVYARDEDGNKIPNMPKSDYMIVDEIQDFSKEEILDFLRATNKNFFFFGDTAQSIYENLKDTMPVERINGMLCDYKAKDFRLFRNYRLPKTVARIVQWIGEDMEGFDIDTYKSKETAIPRFIRYNSFDRQIEAIAKMIKKGSVSDVGILMPHNEAVKKVSDILNENQINHELKYEDKENFRNSIDNLDFTTENPKVMTYHSAKGLQFGTVFLPGIGEYDDDLDNKALYVAMTRTYRNLYVMYTGSLPYPLSKVPSNLYKTTEKDVVEDI
jgi:superfamily I DNA/RNA helicase